MTAFDIVVTSDTVCPWCYVGRKNLLSALDLWKSQHPSSKDTFNVTYAPYQLRPEHPRGPEGAITKEQFYREYFGDSNRVKAMHERLSAVGEKVGIKFQYGSGKIGNTRDSHRLVWLAKKYGKEAEVKAIDGLFKSYFEESGDITDYDLLRRIGRDAGIPEEEFNKTIVESDGGGEEVDLQIAQGRMDGVRGVPDFLIQDKYRFSGAQDAATIVDLLEQVQSSELKEAKSLEGASC